MKKNSENNLWKGWRNDEIVERVCFERVKKVLRLCLESVGKFWEESNSNRSIENEHLTIASKNYNKLGLISA